MYGRVASIPRIDWTKKTNRIKYLNSFNKKIEYIDEVNIDLCGNAETAQIKENPWWTKSTNFAKIERACGTLFRNHVINHE